MIGTKRPVYTAILIPVQHIYGIIIHILFVKSILITDFTSSLKLVGLAGKLSWVNIIELLLVEKGIYLNFFFGDLINRKDIVAIAAIPAIIKK